MNKTGDIMSSKNMEAKSVSGQCPGINSCKGSGACGGKNDSCARQNSCKGKGWLKLSKDDCTKKGRTFKS